MLLSLEYFFKSIYKFLLIDYINFIYVLIYNIFIILLFIKKFYN